MKKKYLLIPALALTLIGAGTASAHGMLAFGSDATPQQIAQTQTARFQQQATLLGISVDEVKAAWAQGKTIQELASEKGITQEQLQQKMTDLRKQHMKDQLQTLVNQGVITQAQADQRLQFIEQRMQNGKLGKGMGHGHGMMTGLGL